MIRFLFHIALSMVLSTIAILTAGWLIDGVSLQVAGFLVAVVVFTVAQAVLAPFVFNIARQYASAVLGGIGLVSSFLSLWIATLFDGGIEIDGLTAWVLTPVLVWIITALGTWILGVFIFDRWWKRREQRRAVRDADKHNAAKRGFRR